MMVIKLRKFHKTVNNAEHRMEEAPTTICYSEETIFNCFEAVQSFVTIMAACLRSLVAIQNYFRDFSHCSLDNCVLHASQAYNGYSERVFLIYFDHNLLTLRLLPFKTHGSCYRRLYTFWYFLFLCRPTMLINPSSIVYNVLWHIPFIYSYYILVPENYPWWQQKLFYHRGLNFGQLETWKSVSMLFVQIFPSKQQLRYCSGQSVQIQNILQSQDQSKII